MDKINEELHDYISAHQSNIRELTAIKNGTVFYRDTWSGFKPENTVHVMSVTKA